MMGKGIKFFHPISQMDMIADLPTSSEIKEYVNIGPTPDYSVTVSKNTFDSTFIIITIVFGLVLIITVSLFIYWAFQITDFTAGELPINQDPTDGSRTLTADGNVGGAISSTQLTASLDHGIYSGCDNTHNAHIDRTGKCVCNDGFYGPNCHQEKHHRSYYAAGAPDYDNLHLNILDESLASGKSFKTGSCSQRCSTTTGCTGFIYRKENDYASEGLCTLIGPGPTTPAVIVNQDDTIPYTLDMESTLYMKSFEQIEFQTRIFLAKDPIFMPRRYWLHKERKNFKQLERNVIGVVDFAPHTIKYDKSLTGIYSVHAFTHDEIDMILRQGNCKTRYIHQPNTNLKLPRHWEYVKKIYVIYI